MGKVEHVAKDFDHNKIERCDKKWIPRCIILPASQLLSFQEIMVVYKDVFMHGKNMWNLGISFPGNLASGGKSLQF